MNTRLFYLLLLLQTKCARAQIEYFFSGSHEDGDYYEDYPEGEKEEGSTSPTIDREFFKNLKWNFHGLPGKGRGLEELRRRPPPWVRGRPEPDSHEFSGEHYPEPEPGMGKRMCRWKECNSWHTVFVLALSSNNTETEFQKLKQFLLKIVRYCPNTNYTFVARSTSELSWCTGVEACARLCETLTLENSGIETTNHDDSPLEFMSYDYYYYTDACSSTTDELLWANYGLIDMLYDQGHEESKEHGTYLLLITDCIKSFDMIQAFYRIHGDNQFEARVILIGDSYLGWEDWLQGRPAFFVANSSGLVQRALSANLPCIPGLHATSFKAEHESKDNSSETSYLALYIVLPLALAITVISCLLFCYQRKKFVWKHRVAKFSNKHGGEQGGTQRKKRYVDFPFIEKREADQWEIVRGSLSIHYESKLGSGAFSTVYKGHLIGEAPVSKIYPTVFLSQRLADCTVAVKVLPDYADAFAKSDFLQEINFMKELGYHWHLVGLLGCVSVDQPLCLITEYCENGDLLHFIRNRKDEILNADQEGENLRFKDLLCFAWQISDGMVHLSSKEIIHRDLAARNVLVDSKRTAKIADFGLCRQLDRAIYTTRGGRLPIKWMALESLRYYEYSTMSDVWSYGVMLYEIFSLGQVPYQSYQPADMTDVLLAGTRMEQPENCPQEAYELMVSCWLENPKSRPTFECIRAQLVALLENATESYGYLNPLCDAHRLNPTED